ncbi:MAG: hypothetical protein KGL74_03975, partial [Elusimicrobia bacterium]|nr:hypothetical protein [Elusimicrobiota bacterium]
GLPARATDDGVTQVDSGPQFARWEHGRWEFGLDLGMIYPTKATTFSHVIDNQRAYDLLVAESVGDEVGEGWVAPPLPGSSVISGKMNQLPDVGVHVYYRRNSWLSYGLDGGYGVRSSLRVQNRGIYMASNFLTLSYLGNIIHLSAPLKLGPAFGPFRPYVLIGPGAYLVQERASIIFNDADDPQLKPLEIVRRNAVYAGIHSGVGFEWRAERGLVGLDVSYHKVFAGGVGADFIEPKLRFAVLF